MRAPTRRQSIIGGAVIVAVGLLLALGGWYIYTRTGGDLATMVGTGAGRSSMSVPAGVATGVLGLLALLAIAFGIWVTRIGWRAAAEAEEFAETEAAEEPLGR